MSFGRPSPQTRTSTHRHAVALPIALVLALAPLSDFWSPLAAQVTPTQTWQAATEQTVDVDFGRAILSPSAAFRRDDAGLTVIDGSVLIDADGLVRVHAGPWLVTAFAGLTHITWRDDAVTVAAVTAASLIQRDDERIILPAGKQWRGADELPAATMGLDTWLAVREALPLPPDFIEQQILRAGVHPAPAAPALHPTRLPTVDEAAATIILADTAGKVAAFPQAMQDADTWILASLHPLTAGLAWVAEPPESVHAGERLLRLLAMPASDIHRSAFPDVVAQRWLDEAETLLPMMPQPDLLVLRLLDVLADASRDAAEHGHPERAQRYLSTGDELARRFAVILSDEQRAAWPPKPVARVATPVPQAASEPVVTVEERDAGPELIAATREALLGMGGLYTAQTRITDLGGHARVTNIALATPNGDTLFDFTLNTAAGTVRDIRRNGETFPNEVTLEQFAEWIATAP